MRFDDDQGRPFAFLESGRLVLTDLAPAHFERCDRLDLRGSPELVELPENLHVEKLLLRGCAAEALARRSRCQLFEPRRLHRDHFPPARLDLQHAQPPGHKDSLAARRLAGDCPTRPDGLPRSDRSPRGIESRMARHASGNTNRRRANTTPLHRAGILACWAGCLSSRCARLYGFARLASRRRDSSRPFERPRLRRLNSLPASLSVSRLDITDCVNLRSLPDGLRVASRIEIANTGLDQLPESLHAVSLRWRGVSISPRIAFQPESITVDEILAETNAELRRVLLERFGLGAVPFRGGRRSPRRRQRLGRRAETLASSHGERGRSRVRFGHLPFHVPSIHPSRPAVDANLPPSRRLDRWL